MNSNISKIVTIGSYVLMGISALLVILFYVGTITEEPFIIWAYFLVILAVISTLVFSFMQLFSSGKNAKNALIGVGILVGLVVISWLIASPEIPQFIGVDEFELTPAISRNVGTGLIATYILAIVAIGSMIYSEISGLFR